MLYTLGSRQVELRGNGHFIAPNATVIGSVILENQVSIWFNAVLRGDNDPIYIGAQSNIQDGAILHTDLGLPLSIGKNVTVGHLAMLHSCTIGDGSLIGIGAVVLNRARIGKGCLIGAKALVTEGKEIPDYSLVMGSPGKVIRQLTEAERQQMYQNSEHYLAHAQEYLQQLSLSKNAY